MFRSSVTAVTPQPPDARDVRAGTLAAHAATVEGVDCSRLSPAEVAEIRRLIAEHGVLVFPSQSLTPADQKRFSALFGEVGEHPMGHRLSATNPDEQLMWTVSSS